MASIETRTERTDMTGTSEDTGPSGTTPGGIVGFLLARIAEDEAATYTLEPYDCEPGCCAPAGWVGSRCHYCDSVASYGGTVEAITAIAEEHAETIHQRPRVLAECQAKRAIIEAHPLTTKVTPVTSGASPGVACQNCHSLDRIHEDTIVEDLGPCDTLLALAAVYVDHPDYDQSWRP